MLRATAAAVFAEIGLQLRAAQKATGSARHIRRLWTLFHERRQEYEAACKVVEAIEQHHIDSYLIEDVRIFMARAARGRREVARDRQDEYKECPDILKFILAEIRSIRDRIDPVIPTALDIFAARQKINKLHEEK